MTLTETRTGILITVLAALASGATSMAIAGESDDPDARQKIIRKIVLDCDEDSGEECAEEIRIYLSGDESHSGGFGDHHGFHYSIDDGFPGNGGFLGVQLTDLTPELRTHFGAADDEGVMVSKVVDDSAAFRAGLQVGDIITRVDGEVIGSTMDLIHGIRTREEGDEVVLEVWRDGSLETMSATLDKTTEVAHRQKSVWIDCEDDERDCGFEFSRHLHRGEQIGCPEGDECDIEVRCADAECECTVNGIEVDCEDLHQPHDQDD